MGHFAKVVNDKVTKVIVAEPEFFSDFVDDSPGTWIQTSYNTFGNQHKLGGTPLRGNFAGIDYTYDITNDVFYAPQPFDSWTLNTTTWLWEPPVAIPDDADDVRYIWNEENQTWDAV